MLLHRVAALGRALLVVGGLALSALCSAASAYQTTLSTQEPAAHIAHATIESREGLPADHIRTGEQVQLVSVEVRSVVCPPVAGSEFARRAHAPADCLGADTLRWCDVIQCRRLGGALLLGFATPPPTSV